MDVTVIPHVAGLAVAGIVAGLWLLARGFRGYRTAVRIADTGTSLIASMAAGEVRISGTIEAAEVALVSPLQSRDCVYYAATIREDGAVSDTGSGLREERAVGFVVRDPSGAVRVFPRGARWDAPLLLDEPSGSFGEAPLGLRLRTGGAFTVAEPDREAEIAALLAVQPDPGDGLHPLLRGRADRGRRRYREARLAPGDTVTVVGRAMPFADLADPAEADIASGWDLAADDPEVAANVAAGREAGILATNPAAAWGNAAIPGFGIGRPVRAPSLHPDADALPAATTDDAERYDRTFHIPSEALVIASAPDVPLLIAHGAPSAAVGRHHDRFIVGLLGAALAIVSATAFAIMLGGGFGS